MLLYSIENKINKAVPQKLSNKISFTLTETGLKTTYKGQIKCKT